MVMESSELKTNIFTICFQRAWVFADRIFLLGSSKGEIVKVKEVCELTELSDSAIRYYEKQGLLMDVKRLDNGYRDYNESHVENLNFIKKQEI